jgi:fructose/tagatose bisphosphate aldolase
VSGKRIIVHSLDDARAALAAASALKTPVTLASAHGAGGYAGPLWFKAIVEAAAAEYPGAEMAAVLDCADEAGTVLQALRHGLKRVRFTGNAAALKRLRAIAGELGAMIETGRAPAALDLREVADPAGAARTYLAEAPAGRAKRR